MARVLVKVDNNWYDELASVSNYYEADIESRILDHAETTFKGYVVLPFKKIINDSGGRSSTPDLVLIREDYSDWYIVEVELYKHGREHPEKQIDVFLDGMYKSADLVPYLLGKKNTLDATLLKKLIDTKQPGVLVIVDGPYANWIEDFRKKVLVCIFEVYKNTAGTELFRLKGDYPYIVTGETHLKEHPSFMYEIIDVQFLPHAHNDSIDVYYMGRKMQGKILFSKNRRFIVIPNSLIPPKKDLVLFQEVNGNYIIRLN